MKDGVLSQGSAAKSPRDVLEQLLESRLVMVTGKGGTGKTTFASALAVMGAAKGKNTLLLEVDAQRPALTTIFDHKPTDRPEEVRDDLWIANLTWKQSLQTFLQGLVPSRRVVKMILGNRLVYRFLDFTPGSQEIVTLSAVAQTVEDYDLVVVDMPASGHAFSLLDITRSALGLFRSGPVRQRANDLRAVLADPSTAMAFVALPEEMVVNETIETNKRMAEYKLLSKPPVVFLNKATLPTLTDDERELIRKLEASDLTPLQEEFVRAGCWEDELEQGTYASCARLEASFDGQTPLLVPPAANAKDSRKVVERVASHLGRSIGLSKRELSW